MRVTFTGASVDSCTGSELEVVVAVSVPRKGTGGQRRANRGAEATLGTAQNPALVSV